MDETVNISTATLTVENTTQERIKPTTWKKFKNVSTKADKSASPMPLWMEKELQKLRKSIRLEMKRLKSEKAKSITATVDNKVKPSEVINLDADNESDNRDVTVIPTLPSPIVIVEDRRDEENPIDEGNKSNKTLTLEDDEKDENNFDKEDSQIKSAVEKICQNKGVMDPLTPKTSRKQEGAEDVSFGRIYFMALNTYESCSDITYNVNTTNSDGNDDVGSTSHKTKRRDPRTNKKSDVSYYNSVYSTDDENEIDDAVHIGMQHRS